MRLFDASGNGIVEDWLGDGKEDREWEDREWEKKRVETDWEDQFGDDRIWNKGDMEEEEVDWDMDKEEVGRNMEQRDTGAELEEEEEVVDEEWVNSKRWEAKFRKECNKD